MFNKSKTKSLISLLLLVALLAACNSKESVLTAPFNETSSTNQTLSKIIDSDDEITSFEPNYDESDISFMMMGDASNDIYPVNFKHKVKLVDKNISVTIEGDSAIGLVTKTFDVTLFIKGSFDEFTRGDSNVVDTVIEKSFQTQMQRYVIFDKIGESEIPDSTWHIKAVSLPEGGTLMHSVAINKVTVFYPNGETFEVTSPNDFYLYRQAGKRQVPNLLKNRPIKVEVEIASPYEADEFVTVNYGAHKFARQNRGRKLFNLVSSDFNGTNYIRTYERVFETNQDRGCKHAIINVIPNEVLTKVDTQVEETTWGIPYIVK